MRKIADRYYSCPNCNFKIPSGVGTMFCNKCETIYCSNCSSGGQCPCCRAMDHQWTRAVYEEQEKKRINKQFERQQNNSEVSIQEPVQSEYNSLPSLIKETQTEDEWNSLTDEEKSNQLSKAERLKEWSKNDKENEKPSFFKKVIKVAFIAGLIFVAFCMFPKFTLFAGVLFGIGYFFRNK